MFSTPTPTGQKTRPDTSKRCAGVSQISMPSALTPSSTVTTVPGSESGTPGYHDQCAEASEVTALLRSSGVVFAASKGCLVGTLMAPTRYSPGGSPAISYLPSN